MAKPKQKAGKQAKDKKVSKIVPRKAAARPTPKAAAPKAAPAAAPQAAVKGPSQYPCKAVVNKGAEKLPVTLTSAEHYARLCEEFGAKYIEVQS